MSSLTYKVKLFLQGKISYQAPEQRTTWPENCKDHCKDILTPETTNKSLESSMEIYTLLYVI